MKPYYRPAAIKNKNDRNFSTEKGLTHYADKPFTGVQIDIFKYTEWLNGKLHGRYVTFYEEGYPKCIAEYENGELKWYCNYDPGFQLSNRHGAFVPHIVDFADPDIKRNHPYSSIGCIDYKNQPFDGILVRKFEYGEFKDATAVGAYLEFDSSGQITSIEYFYDNHDWIDNGLHASVNYGAGGAVCATYEEEDEDQRLYTNDGKLMYADSVYYYRTGEVKCRQFYGQKRDDRILAMLFNKSGDCLIERYSVDNYDENWYYDEALQRSLYEFVTNEAPEYNQYNGSVHGLKRGAREVDLAVAYLTQLYDSDPELSSSLISSIEAHHDDDVREKIMKLKQQLYIKK
ncbi:hypothetical protein [Chitinophaga flava]|uniref:Uncharacterized protein n=1 Tax=Chitinophaga flava TaxID=2259036 RepID=A0A365XX10_9BACT|nr:hypothetical protein [Chitinophaga flava]RBL90541.1 hypothetical protein DF182_29230 [Chitinophaga flava]